MAAAVAPAVDKKRSAALPISLTALRAVLAPVVFLLALKNLRGLPIVLCVLAALVSDYFDGVTARRLGVVTAALRRFDSVTDTVFYLAVLGAVWRLERPVVFRFAGLLVPLLALEVIRIVFERVKFGHAAAYHMWSSKLWGLLLAVATMALLGYGTAGKLLVAALAMGILCDLEGLAISVLLPAAAHDVPTFVHALRIRKQMSELQSVPAAKL